MQKEFSHMPRVSVVIPAYNVECYIKATLRSLQSQSFSDFEAFVVDDGSTDSTAKIIQSFCQQDVRFRLLSKPNGGLSSARNWGIQHARCEYIALLDGDDIYFKDKLAAHVEILDDWPQVGVVYSGSRAIRDDGKSTFIYLTGKPLYSDSALLSLLCKNFVGHGSNAVFRHSLIEQVGFFDETLGSCEDLDFWLRIAETDSEFHRIPQVLCGYRVRPSGLSFNVDHMQQTLMSVIESACSRNLELIAPMLPTVKAYSYRYLARLSAGAGQPKQAKAFIDQAWEADRSIFFRDARSLLTLLAIKLNPISQWMISRTLGVSTTRGTS